MPLKMVVPLNRVQLALAGGLVLDHPQRCSRCGAVPAAHYESHSLRLRIGQKRPGLYRQRYRLNQAYRLRIRICEICYRTDFVTSIEELEKDDTRLGRLARTYARAFSIGGVIAGFGLLLMTNLIPADSALGGVKLNWPFITGAGGAIILMAWLHQRDRMRRILEELEAAGTTPASRPRAEVRTPVLDNDNDPQAVTLEVTMRDEAWLVESAAHYNFPIEEFNPVIKEGEE